MEMLKRKDGSVSRRGLWDNIRANKGSGKKPTAAMLKQEKKIKAKKAKDGTNVAKSDTSSMYNKKTDTQEIKKPLSDVPVRPGFKGLLKENLDKVMSNRDSTDYQNTKAKTTAGKVLRGANKVASTAARAIMSPLTVTASTVGAGIKAGVNAIKNKQDLNKIPKQKMGGKVASKMMMKTKKK